MIGGRAATSTRRPGFSVPYALQTLLDELTMRAGGAARRRAGRDRAARRRRRGRLRRADRGGRDDLHAALRAAHVRRQLRLPRGELPALAVAGAARAAPRADRGARRRRSRRPPREALPPSAQDGLGASRRGARRRTRRCAFAALTEPHERVGAGRRHRLDRGAGGRRGAAARPREDRAPGARFPPSAASSPSEMFAELERRGCHVRDRRPGRRCGA